MEMALSQLLYCKHIVDCDILRFSNSGTTQQMTNTDVEPGPRMSYKRQTGGVHIFPSMKTEAEMHWGQLSCLELSEVTSSEKPLLLQNSPRAFFIISQGQNLFPLVSISKTARPDVQGQTLIPCEICNVCKKT